MDLIVRVVIRGRVQGVGYRAWTEYEAQERGIAGWVRNCRDGAVEALFAGARDDVRAMIEACREGPPGARVQAIDQLSADASDLTMRRGGEMFSVLSTV
jgi:acylphosphatase